MKETATIEFDLDYQGDAGIISLSGGALVFRRSGGLLIMGITPGSNVVGLSPDQADLVVVELVAAAAAVRRAADGVPGGAGKS